MSSCQCSFHRLVSGPEYFESEVTGSFCQLDDLVAAARSSDFAEVNNTIEVRWCSRGRWKPDAVRHDRVPQLKPVLIAVFSKDEVQIILCPSLTESYGRGSNRT